MEWRQVSENWAAFVEAIGTRWPRADDDDVLAIDGDRARFEEYIASTHDLTPAEAREDVEGWLMGELPVDVAMDESRDSANIRDSGKHIPAGEDVYAEDRDFGDDRPADRPIGRTGKG